MIIIKLTDGLGNQLFQFALGKSLSEKSNVELKFDKSWYDESSLQSAEFTKRDFELEKLNVNVKFASKKEIKNIINPNLWKPFRILFWLIQRYLPYYRKRKISEQERFFDSRILKLKGHHFLTGFYQSFKYFIDIRDPLIDEISLKFESNNFKEYKALISSKPVTASIHIRRGDYNSPNSTHICLDKEYYIQAINLLKKQIKPIHWFIFSDDLEWCKQQLFLTREENVTFVEEDEPTSALLLQSLCHHQIIANSTLSWWGAWLNKSNKKVIIAPESWLKGDKGINQDLIPQEWITLP